MGARWRVTASGKLYEAPDPGVVRERSRFRSKKRGFARDLRPLAAPGHVPVPAMVSLTPYEARLQHPSERQPAQRPL